MIGRWPGIPIARRGCRLCRGCFHRWTIARLPDVIGRLIRWRTHLAVDWMIDWFDPMWVDPRWTTGHFGPAGLYRIAASCPFWTRLENPQLVRRRIFRHRIFRRWNRTGRLDQIVHSRSGPTLPDLGQCRNRLIVVRFGPPIPIDSDPIDLDPIDPGPIHPGPSGFHLGRHRIAPRRQRNLVADRQWGRSRSREFFRWMSRCCPARR